MAGSVTSCSSDSENTTLSPTAWTSSDADLGEDEEDEEKICAVCGDRATGYHFHVMTCEGCKGFFRRTVIKEMQFTCPFTQSCTITKAKRRQCQACRYQKCLAVGMRKDMIMSDEALRLRREQRRQKRHPEPRPMEESPENSSLTAEQQQLIEILTEAYKKNVDLSFSPFLYYQTPVRLFIHSPGSHSPPNFDFSPLGHLPSPDPMESSAEEVLPDVFSVLPLLADLSTFMIQQVIQFAKAIPFFRNLSVEDQISLLKGAALEVCAINYNMVFDLKDNVWACGPHSYTIKKYTQAGVQQTHAELIQKFHVSLRKLNLDETEYILLQALVLFSPDTVTVSQWEEIDQIQAKIALTLQSYIDHCHPLPEGRFLYAKLILLLTELQTLKVDARKQILHIKDAEDFSSMTPLLSEIIS